MMIAALNPQVALQSLAQLSAERILNCTVEGMIVATLAWLVLRTLGPQNSGTRFAVWFAALSGIAALPLLGGWASHGTDLAKRSQITMPASWALYIFAAWLVMAAAGLLRVGVGFWHLHRLRKNCVPVDFAALDPMLRKTLEEFDSPRAVTLCTSEQLRVPTAIGFTKPLVVIPSWTMQDLSTAELNAILLHELAHLRRRDDWTNLVQKILGALLFFHPAVWWIEKKLALEREMACDDLVLAQTANPRAYAECLVALAEKSFLRRGLALAQAAVDRLRNVSLRVSQILDAKRPSATRVWRPAPVLVTGVSLACLIALSQMPTRLVSFDDNRALAAASPAASSEAQRDEMKQMAQMGAHLVPARLQVLPEDVRPRNKGLVQTVAKSAGSAVKDELKKASKSDVIAASLEQRQAGAPRLVRISMASDAAAPQNLFFVTQTEVVRTRQYDASGALVWDLCVWRVTVVGPVQNKMEAVSTAKSI
jgi:beta-lactamase regulating signal transducer with metallopeptidase domain